MHDEKLTIAVHTDCQHLLAVHHLMPSAASVSGPYGCDMCDCDTEQGSPTHPISRREAEDKHLDELVTLGLRTAEQAQILQPQ